MTETMCKLVNKELSNGNVFQCKKERGGGHFTLVGKHKGRASEKVVFKLRQVTRKRWLCRNEDVNRLGGKQ